MQACFEGQKVFSQSKLLNSIRAIEQSLMILKQKLVHMKKRQSQAAQQTQKVFYSSVPNLKSKLYRTIECQKAKQKKNMLFNDNVLKQKKKINLQRKMINEKEIERNKELMNMMKINECNSVKERSKKNQLFIQKMKNFRIEENKKKRELVKGSLQNSRHKIEDFQTTKIQSIQRQKEEEALMMKKKVNKMQTELSYLGEKENETLERLDKSEEALKHLRFAVQRMQKINENDFTKLKNKIQSEAPEITQERLIEKMLLSIIESEKSLKTTFQTRKLHQSKWSYENLISVHRG